jgi:Tfp pilus assembly major pilin PilA
MMRTINRQNIFIRIMSITTIIAASIVLVILITEFENFGIAQGQVTNNTSSLTPHQKAAMCNPNNPKLKFVNSTESKICGIPRTPANNTATTLAANTTGVGTRTGNGIPLPHTSVLSSSNTPTMAKQLPSLYEQGYAKGVADAKSVQITTRPSGTMKPDDVDCDSDVDPKASNEGYCSGYQQGYADTNNHELLVR